MNESNRFWFGDTMWVRSVYQPGAHTVWMNLLKAPEMATMEGYVDLNTTNQYFALGQRVDVEYEWTNNVAVLARIDIAKPAGKKPFTLVLWVRLAAHDTLEDDCRAVEIFPPRSHSSGRRSRSRLYEDHGTSAMPQIPSFLIGYHARDAKVMVAFEKRMEILYKPASDVLHIIMPIGDGRPGIQDDGKALMISNTDHARKIFR